jgi:hypothetical protein
VDEIFDVSDIVGRRVVGNIGKGNIEHPTSNAEHREAEI